MNERFIIGVDFDGTMVKHRFPHIGDPVPGALEWLRKYHQKGASLLLWTIRCKQGSMGDVLTPAIEWSEQHGIYFWGVNENPDQRNEIYSHGGPPNWSTSPKVFAHIYADDSAAGAPLIYEAGHAPYLNWSLVGPHIEKVMHWYQQLGDVKIDTTELNHGSTIYSDRFDLSPQIELPEPRLIEL